MGELLVSANTRGTGNGKMVSRSSNLNNLLGTNKKKKSNGEHSILSNSRPTGPRLLEPYRRRILPGNRITQDQGQFSKTQSSTYPPTYNHWNTPSHHHHHSKSQKQHLQSIDCTKFPTSQLSSDTNSPNSALICITRQLGTRHLSTINQAYQATWPNQQDKFAGRLVWFWLDPFGPFFDLQSVHLVDR